MTLSDYISPKIEARIAQFVPERMYPTQAKPLRKKKPFKLRDLEPWMRRRLLDRREDRLGASSRINARYAGESAAAASDEKIAIYCHYSSTDRVSGMVQSQLATYAAEGFEVIFVSMCNSLSDDDIAPEEALPRNRGAPEFWPRLWRLARRYVVRHRASRPSSRVAARQRFGLGSNPAR